MVVDFVIRQERRPASLGPRRQLVPEANVRERAAHHHLVIAAAGAVRVEVARRDTFRDEVSAGGAVGRDRTRWRDVICRHAVAKDGEHPRRADVRRRGWFERQPVEKRRVADVGGVFIPRESLPRRDRQAAPSLVAVEHRTRTAHETCPTSPPSASSPGSRARSARCP